MKTKDDLIFEYRCILKSIGYFDEVELTRMSLTLYNMAKNHFNNEN